MYFVLDIFEQCFNQIIRYDQVMILLNNLV